MVTRFSFLALSLLAASAVEAKPENVINQDSSVNISPDSDIGRHLLSKARRVEEEDNYDNYYEDMDINFIADYSLKFQGCHHVQQWNPNSEGDEDAVRIMTKRLVRFRLCAGASCNSDSSAGCSSNYGDYVIDMDTFLQAYVEAAQNNGYYGRRLRELDENGFDLTQFTECSAYQDDFYIGPYCANQGGAIKMGVFTDYTCSTFSSNDYYYYSTGTALPYSDESLVSMSCMSCNVNSDAYQYANYANGGADAEANDFCTNLYYTSGKCEKKMNIGYPNEGACSYIDGVKIIREDGVIRTSANRKSKVAAVFIGLFLTIAFMLAGYVYYLRTKLTRARVNLSAATGGQLS
jgi:hypothetical protein